MRERRSVQQELCVDIKIDNENTIREERHARSRTRAQFANCWATQVFGGNVVDVVGHTTRKKQYTQTHTLERLLSVRAPGAWASLFMRVYTEHTCRLDIIVAPRIPTHTP